MWSEYFERGGGHHRLKTLGQFPAQGNPALSQNPVQFLQCSYQMVGRLVEYYGAAYRMQGLDEKAAMKQVARDRGVSKRDIYWHLHVE